MAKPPGKLLTIATAAGLAIVGLALAAMLWRPDWERAVLLIALAIGITHGIWVARSRGHTGPIGALLGSALGAATAMSILGLVVGIVEPPTLIDVPTFVALVTVAGLAWGAFVGIFAAMCVWAAQNSSTETRQ